MHKKGASQARGEREIAEKVAFLAQPGSYQEDVSQVEVLETHMSWVFLTDRHAYKLKKPFRRGRIDYLTAASRRRSCAGELRLNRRLAPDVYLGIVPLTVDASRKLALDGPGRRVDWLVKMRRMDAGLSLENRLRGRLVVEGDACRIMQRLVPFFVATPRAHWTGVGYRRRLISNIGLVERELLRPQFALDRADVEEIAKGLRHFVAVHRDALDARLHAGRIGEGHGDLRPEHIYLTDPVTVMDCIEFDRNLRLRDPIDELSFLSMECDRLGEPRFDGWLFAAYRDAAGDDPPRPLIEFHKACNAFVRAQIAIWHLIDPEPGPQSTWIPRANDYLDRAKGYLSMV